mmetsp:Transcript_18022/g.38941  ORF Transcript_18022/g.38941 Transcript_18022/m.38941 type:complete len:521 (-) Transcript_18022:661-2223(-)|eukprot:CAMPEP_0172307712 /NCGR_PEP_ID=MMETSP1058-20130122/8505_1 /TAXON_ID=83371 /ORGANISM="Detonula confervacea, Strain CCMP 353" /LENGTH=520 /DNA_ID=CAMNT_0013019949 /DNA_START=265 /DNA_END=1827 /DNA_ORIENTATION=-
MESNNSSTKNQENAASTSKKQMPPEKKPNKNPKSRQTTRTWSAGEDIQLARLVGNEPDVAKISWNAVALRMNNRKGKQCRERYVNNLTPDRKKGQWTEEEDTLILGLQTKLGNQWSKISAELPGRSDNDVKNRWHSKHRSKTLTLKRNVIKMGDGDKSSKEIKDQMHNIFTSGRDKKRSKPTLMEDAPSHQHKKSSNVNLAMVPKVGQRVQVKFDEGQMYGGTISKVSQQPYSQRTAYDITICYDDGVSEDSVFPDSDVQLIPTKNRLTKNEDTLCNELLNLHSTLKEPETHDDYLFEHIATNVKVGILSHKGSGEDSHKTGVAKTADLDNAAASPSMARPTITCSALKDSPAISASDSSVGSHKTDGESNAMQKENGSKWPMTGIRRPGHNDCLTGRGGGTNFHPGNIKYRTFIEDNKVSYRAATRSYKSTMSMKIVQDWRSQDPPGRFLKINEQTGLWDDVGDEESRIKCSQALREKKVSKLAVDPNVYASRAANSIARQTGTEETTEVPETKLQHNH